MLIILSLCLSIRDLFCRDLGPKSHQFQRIVKTLKKCNVYTAFNPGFTVKVYYYKTAEKEKKSCFPVYKTHFSVQIIFIHIV